MLNKLGPSKSNKRHEIHSRQHWVKNTDRQT